MTADYAVETSFVEHAYIEPEAGYAVRRGDRIEVFGTTQAPYMDRDEVAGVLGIAPEQVRIIPRPAAAASAASSTRSFQPILAVAAWITGQPVRMRLDPAREHGRLDQAPSRPDHGQRRGRCRRPAHRRGLPRRLRHRCLRLLGPDRGQPRARPRHRALRRAAPPAAPRAASTPTARRPAPSAASACRRAPSRTRR